MKIKKLLNELYEYFQPRFCLDLEKDYVELKLSTGAVKTEFTVDIMQFTDLNDLNLNKYQIYSKK